MGTLVIIRLGQVEPITAFVVDNNGDPLPGKSDIFIKIRRYSDSFYLDWSDNTFKVSGSVTAINQQLVPVDNANSPGEYHLNTVTHVLGWDTSKVTNIFDNEVYIVTAIQTPASDAANVPQVGEIKIGTPGLINREPVVF
jgi:hypothetical protein